jgi:serine/threonine protein kinase
VSVGDIVAGCRIEAVAGRGGMGVVFRARQLSLDRAVALKAIAPALAGDEQYRARFQREARLAAAIEHPNVLPVYEAGELPSGELYLIMRWVEGTDLRQLLARERGLSAGRAVTLLSPVARALDAAHARGLVHRDIKPANVLLTAPSEHVYLTDFGVARLASEEQGLTKTGGFVGTFAYAAPERMTGGADSGPAGDVYSLGCMLFEVLTGRGPFTRDSELATIQAHVNDPIPSARADGVDVPVALDEVVQKSACQDSPGALLVRRRDGGRDGRLAHRPASAHRDTTADTTGAGKRSPRHNRRHNRQHNRRRSRPPHDGARGGRSSARARCCWEARWRP